METRQVGCSGLRVSRLGLGTMTWGRDTSAENARALLEMFCEAGGSLIDTGGVSLLHKTVPLMLNRPEP